MVCEIVWWIGNEESYVGDEFPWDVVCYTGCCPWHTEDDGTGWFPKNNSLDEGEQRLSEGQVFRSEEPENDGAGCRPNDDRNARNFQIVAHILQKVLNVQDMEIVYLSWSYVSVHLIRRQSPW